MFLLFDYLVFRSDILFIELLISCVPVFLQDLELVHRVDAEYRDDDERYYRTYWRCEVALIVALELDGVAEEIDGFELSPYSRG